MLKLKTSNESKYQNRDQRHHQHEYQVRQSPFHPMGLHLPRPEQYFVEVENPQPSRHAEQDQVRNVSGAMQNDAIIHDGPRFSMPLTES